MQNFIANLNSSLRKTNNFSDIVFLCIGTNKVVGDSFGPIVGEKLKNTSYDLKVIGNLNNCIIYQDIEKIEKEIYEKYKKPYIVCIDAAFSNTIEKGQIVVEKNGMQIGKTLGKKEKVVGNLSIKGVVARSSENYRENFNALTMVKPKIINLMADEVASGIEYVYFWKNWKE